MILYKLGAAELHANDNNDKLAIFYFQATEVQWENDKMADFYLRFLVNIVYLHHEKTHPEPAN
jgi:hypothetical protein